ncbi:MAG: phospholipase D family protein [Eubacteriaceae bacterium]|nr:phospholipase D family protein [Eubacteriaceae bacterium]
MKEQISLFDNMSTKDVENITSKGLSVVKATFDSAETMKWQEIFDGFDHLQVITFSSGMDFAARLLAMFDDAEIIFGCEGVLNTDIATVMAMQQEIIYALTENKSVEAVREKMEEGHLNLYLSKDVKSHEKIFCLKSDDGRTRVVTGSANMSASAFMGFQRENIIIYDDEKAYDYYSERFETFKASCASELDIKTLKACLVDRDYLSDHPEELPIIKGTKGIDGVLIEPTREEDHNESVIVANIKNTADEIKPLLSKPKKDDGKLYFSKDNLKIYCRKRKGESQVKKTTRNRLPKLHLDYDTHTVSFNEKPYNMTPDGESVKSDMMYLTRYLDSLDAFYGDSSRAKEDYYQFLNWYFSSPFYPYLRQVAHLNNYDILGFPEVGIIYGDSNGGKTTFVKLLSKMLSGVKVKPNASSDFTRTNIDTLKMNCEGLPIYFDDLDKKQFSNHSDSVIKNDDWGIAENQIHYPALAITTNKLPSLDAAISKRAIGCRINIRIDKEKGIKYAKTINESLERIGNAFFSEYARRMFHAVSEMAEMMKTSEDDYFPDVFAVSSQTLCDIFAEYMEKEDIPDYVRPLSHSDYFGEKVIGKNAIEKIVRAWESEPEQFTVDKKKNRLIYTYPDGANYYELRYIKDELPPRLDAQTHSRTLDMDLKAAEDFFELRFKRPSFWERLFG